MKKNVNGKFKYNLFEPDLPNRTDKVVILYHGWGVTVDGYSDIAKDIQSEGYTVIVPELIYHDTRTSLANPFEPEIMQSYFWKFIIESIEEFDE